jgi:hypothetical protein
LGRISPTRLTGRTALSVAWTTKIAQDGLAARPAANGYHTMEWSGGVRHPVAASPKACIFAGGDRESPRARRIRFDGDVVTLPGGTFEYDLHRSSTHLGSMTQPVRSSFRFHQGVITVAKPAPISLPSGRRSTRPELAARGGRSRWRRRDVDGGDAPPTPPSVRRHRVLFDRLTTGRRLLCPLHRLGRISQMKRVSRSRSWT